MNSERTEQALLLSAQDAARLCGVSERTWRCWDAGGRMPNAVDIGRSKFWRRKEIEDWVGQGCPDRKDWQVLNGETS